MEKVNCLRCRFRHEDNGNCTAVGGFCTAVPAAHCPLLREYLDTGLTPAEVRSMSGEWRAMMSVLNSIGGGYDRLRELAEADKDGRLVVLPCKVGDTVYRIFNPPSREPVISAHTLMSVDYIVRWIDKFGKTVFLTREEAEKALKTKEG